MANNKSTTNMTSPNQASSVNFTTITKADIASLMPIENACHSHPWSEKTFASCLGGRYFGEKISVQTHERKANEAVQTSSQSENTKKDPPQKINSIGFYIGEYVAGEATLMDICVAPTIQGKGYGKTLLKQFLAQAKQQGATKIFLEVRAKNISAQMLYLNAGFIEINRRTGYYPSASGFGYEDAIVMSLRC
jgi:ribosomal-protein-alanine N-acetyltransferase